MKRNSLNKILVFATVFLFFLIVIPTANSETEYFYNSYAIIFGKSSNVQGVSLLWRAGLYIPILKRNFYISANEENESLNAIFFKPNSKYIYIDSENITIDIIRARGVFYWFEKSLLFNMSAPQPVFFICKAKSIYVTTY